MKSVASLSFALSLLVLNLSGTAAAALSIPVPQTGVYEGRTTEHPTSPICSLSVARDPSAPDTYRIQVNEGTKTVGFTLSPDSPDPTEAGDSPFCRKIGQSAETDYLGVGNWMLLCSNFLSTQRLYVNIKFAFAPQDIELPGSRVRRILGVSSTKILGGRRESISCSFRDRE